jgi:hypothetical protein
MKTTQNLGCALALTALAIFAGSAAAHDDPAGRGGVIPTPNLKPFANASGMVATYNVNGRIDPRNAFFQPLSTNGSSCDTCHKAAEAFSITPPSIRERFERTKGRDPLFAPVDGANCANAKRSSRADLSLLLDHGLIRVAQPVPVDAQFSISVIHDPFGCALVSDAKTWRITASVYRRPLPTTNISFLSTVMWDGRETLAPPRDPRGDRQHDDQHADAGGEVTVHHFDPGLAVRHGASRLRGLRHCDLVARADGAGIAVAAGPVGTAETRVGQAREGAEEREVEGQEQREHGQRVQAAGRSCARVALPDP